MASEKFRSILPWISIGIGILVYVLYYMSSQSWKQAEIEYEKQQIEERKVKTEPQQANIEDNDMWISEDGKEIYSIINSGTNESGNWIVISELNSNKAYRLYHVPSASGVKYSNSEENIFWTKGDEAFFEENKTQKSKLNKVAIFKGLYSYMADANLFKLCNSDKQYPIAFAGDHITIERAYLKLEKSGKDVYLELSGALVNQKAMEGNSIIQAIYPYKMLSISDTDVCL